MTQSRISTNHKASGSRNTTDMDLTRIKFQQSIDELRKYLPRLDLLDQGSNSLEDGLGSFEIPTDNRLTNPEATNSVYDDLFEYPEDYLNNEYDPKTAPQQHSSHLLNSPTYDEYDWLKSPFSEKDDVNLYEDVPEQFLTSATRPVHDKLRNSGEITSKFDSLMLQEQFPSIRVATDYDPESAAVNPDEMLDKRVHQSYNDFDYLPIASLQRLSGRYYRSTKDRHDNR